MLAPHLPAPSCNIKGHERWINLKCILASSFLGLVAGVSGASIVLGWIWPNYGEGDTWIVSRSKGVSTGTNLEEIVRKESTERIFSVYRGSSKIDSLEYLPLSEKIGEAVAISSDGWLAMYVKQGISAAITGKLRIISSDGAVFAAEKYLFDYQTKIAYIKISGSVKTSAEDSATTQFKVASFEEIGREYQEIFVHESGDWRFAETGYRKNLPPLTSRIDSAPSYVYSLNGNFSAGSVAITARGRVAGFITDTNELIPAVALTRIMPGVLDRQKIEYPSFGVSGWFSEIQPAFSQGNKLTGFVVANVWSRASKLRRGDVIMEINGQIIRDESLWYNIGDKEVTLTISRAGKVFDLTAVIIKASSDLK